MNLCQGVPYLARIGVTPSLVRAHASIVSGYPAPARKSAGRGPGRRVNMSDNDYRVTRPDEVPAATPAGQPGPAGPLAPADGPGTQVEPAVTATYRMEPVTAGRPGGPGAGAGGHPGGPEPRRKKTVPRGLFWVVLTQLIAACVAIAGLVVLKPFKAAPSALATIPPTPAGSSPASSASASPSPSGGGSSAGAASGSPSAGPSPSSTATVPPATSGTNLFNLTAVQNIGAYNLVNGSEQIGTTTYPDSVRFTCASGENVAHTYLVYDVAGFSFLNATIGVPSDATNAAGNTMGITFFKDGTTQQLGKTITIALDQPGQVHLNLDGASQLEIGCAATSTANQQAVQMDVALGNAVLTN
jgi:hypothetical protein